MPHIDKSSFFTTSIQNNDLAGGTFAAIAILAFGGSNSGFPLSRE